MVLKDETFLPEPAKNHHLVFGKSTHGLWTGLAEPISSADVWVEISSINRVDDQWIVYYDRYRKD